MRRTALDSISFKRIPAHDTIARAPAPVAGVMVPADVGTPEGARKAAQTRAAGGGPRAEQPTGRMPRAAAQQPQPSGHGRGAGGQASAASATATGFGGSANTIKAMQQLLRSDSRMDDAREKDPQDLMDSHGLNQQEAEHLYHMVQSANYGPESATQSLKGWRAKPDWRMKGPMR